MFRNINMLSSVLTEDASHELGHFFSYINIIHILTNSGLKAIQSLHISLYIVMDDSYTSSIHWPDALKRPFRE